MANERGKYYPNTSTINSFPDEHGSSINPVESAIAVLKESLVEFETLSSIVKRERELIESASGNVSASNLLLSKERETCFKRLTDLINKFRSVRKWWEGLDEIERAKYPEINSLIQKNQNIVFLIINWDRENEQKLLKMGKVPANHIPAHQKQSPNYITKLYQKNSTL